MSSGTKATFLPMCFWMTYGSRSCAAQLIAQAATSAGSATTQSSR